MILSVVSTKDDLHVLNIPTNHIHSGQGAIYDDSSHTGMEKCATSKDCRATIRIAMRPRQRSSQAEDTHCPCHSLSRS